MVLEIMGAGIGKSEGVWCGEEVAGVLEAGVPLPPADRAQQLEENNNQNVM